MNPDHVSVVIPTYNRGHTIERAVDSALAQDHPSLEVIVVDDGSTDDTAARMNARYGRDPRVKFVQQPNGGVCVARNTGLARARGEFVAMLDSDDLWLPGKLTLQLGILRSHPELSMVWSDMAAVDPAGRVVSPRYQDAMFAGSARRDRDPRFFGGSSLFSEWLSTAAGVRYRIGHIAHAQVLGNRILTSTVVARARRLAAAGRYDQACHPTEDQDYYCRLCQTGPVAYVDAATVHYTIGAEDAESGPRRDVANARSYLKVLAKLELQRPELVAQLPRGSLELARSEGYARLARALFREGRMAEARRYYWRRLRATPTDLSAAKFMAASVLPPALVRALRSAKGRFAAPGSATTVAAVTAVADVLDVVAAIS